MNETGHLPQLLTLFDEQGTPPETLQDISRVLGLPITSSPPQTPLCLTFTNERIEIHSTERSGPGPLYVDFSEGSMGYRQRHAMGRNEAIAKAVGVKKDFRPSILDLTAGLGRDGFILATLGCRVQLIERSPVIYQLLKNGIDRIHDLDGYSEAAAHMKLLLADSTKPESLSGRVSPVEVAYLDPMYPHQKKSAMVKKEMRYLRDLVGDDMDADQLFETAKQYASKRVVVKRPRHAPPIQGREPSFSQTGKNTRFDIYLL